MTTTTNMIERLRHGYPSKARLEAADTIEAQAKQIEALQADADRYRFWRDRYPETFAPTDLTPADVDRLTDAAIDANRKGNV